MLCVDTFTNFREISLGISIDMDEKLTQPLPHFL